MEIKWIFNRKPSGSCKTTVGNIIFEDTRNLKKGELIALIHPIDSYSTNHNGFLSFHDDLFSKQKKTREFKIRCCGKLFKESSINKHLQTKAHQNYKPKKASHESEHRVDFDNMQRLHRMTIDQPRAFCRTRGITGYSKLRRKADIIPYIEGELFKRHYAFDPDLFSDSRERRTYTPLEVETAFKSRLKTYNIHNEHNLKLPEDFLSDVSPLVRGLITKHLKRLHGLKVNFQFLCDHEKGTTKR